MKRIKDNKGITLVALIITIIVLLILAVVAISAVTGDGIIAHAKNARDDYQAAQDKENTALADYMTELNNAQGEVGTGENPSRKSEEKKALVASSSVKYQLKFKESWPTEVSFTGSKTFIFVDTRYSESDPGRYLAVKIYSSGDVKVDYNWSGFISEEEIGFLSGIMYYKETDCWDPVSNSVWGTMESKFGTNLFSGCYLVDSDTITVRNSDSHYYSPSNIADTKYLYDFFDITVVE